MWQSALRFALVGVSNTFIGLAVIYLAWRVLGLPDLAANALGYAIGFLWSFMMNRRWSFQAEGPTGQHFRRFVLVCALAYTANVLVLMLSRSWLGPEGFLPHALGMATYSVLAFIGSRRYAFVPR